MGSDLRLLQSELTVKVLLKCAQCEPGTMMSEVPEGTRKKLEKKECRYNALKFHFPESTIPLQEKMHRSMSLDPIGKKSKIRNEN